MVRPQIPLRRPLAWTLDRVVVAYQRWISPLTPPACRFHPSCSAYARDALASHALWRALGLTIWRLLRCQPFSKGGLDPVPPGPHSLPCDHHHDDHHRDLGHGTDRGDGDDQAPTSDPTGVNDKAHFVARPPSHQGALLASSRLQSTSRLLGPSRWLSASSSFSTLYADEAHP